MEQPNYYAILPSNVRYDRELSYLARILYAEITSLSNKEGYCYATNSYFEKLYNVSKSTIIRALSSLLKRGYIKVQIKYSKDSKRVLERRIYIVDLVSNMTPGSVKNDTRGGVKNDTENNIKKNNKNKYNSNFSKRNYNDEFLQSFYE